MRPTRLGFVLWCWAMLLVIAISAAPDGGAPGSRDIGSAFDPATSSVALGPQAPREVVAVLVEQAPVPVFAAGGAGLALVLVFGTGAALALRPRHNSRAFPAGNSRSTNRAHGARAPPVS